MRDELVLYVTAKLANKKGFIGFSEDRYNRLGELKENKSWSISAPTQTSLNRWLREVHGIKVISNTDITLSWVWNIQSLHPQASYTGNYINDPEVYITYEDALEIGLQEALKLITL